MLFGLDGVVERLYRREELKELKVTWTATGAEAWPGVAGGVVEVDYLD